MQRAIRILENELHQAAVSFAALDPQGLAVDPQGWCRSWNQTGNRFQDSRFARPGFTDDAEGFAFGNRKRNAAHRMDRLPAAAECDGEIIDLDHASHSGSRVTTVSSACGRSSEGADLISARV